MCSRQGHGERHSLRGGLLHTGLARTVGEAGRGEGGGLDGKGMWEGWVFYGLSDSDASATTFSNRGALLEEGWGPVLTVNSGAANTVHGQGIAVGRNAWGSG